MHDVIIIGGGFAGCSAAREVRRAGLNAMILEARDRIGGRTWTADWDGRGIERGGGWVHWFQPHVWTEIMRHGLTPVPGFEAERVYWPCGDQRRSGSHDDYEKIANRAWNKFVEGAEQMLPLPHLPLTHPDRIARIDGLTIRERISELDLTDEEEGVLIAETESVASGPIDQAGAFSVIRWHALSGFSLTLTQETGGFITIAEGTRGILTPILREASAEIHFDTPVAAIEQQRDSVVVTTRAGEAIPARAVVVTTPLNALSGIDFAAGLSELKQEGIAYGQASRGIKIFIRVRGPQVRCNAVHPDHPFGHVSTQLLHDDGTQTLIGFGSDYAKCRPDDLGWVQEQLDRTLPGYQVLASSATDWLSDEFSRGTWAIHRPGWYLRFHAEMQRPEGRVVLAGADIANGWAGFIDGAVESGTRGGRLASSMV